MAFTLRILPVLLVVMMAFYNQEALGMNNSSIATPSVSSVAATTTMAPAAATTTQISPTATQTVSPTSSAAPPADKFDTNVMVSLKVDKCNNESKEVLKDAIRTLYEDDAYDYKSTDFTMANNEQECIVNFTMKFGKKLNKTDIIEKFRNDKNINGTLLSINANVEKVTLGEYSKPSDASCKEKCCGIGGQITEERKCTPEKRCFNYELKRIVPDCSKVCNICDGTMLKVSLLVLLISGLINWFLKE